MKFSSTFSSSKEDYIIHQALTESLTDAPYIIRTMLEGIQSAFNEKREQFLSTGTTAVCGFIADDRYHMWNVGDSAGFLYEIIRDSEGNFIQLRELIHTEYHHPDAPKELERIKAIIPSELQKLSSNSDSIQKGYSYFIDCLTSTGEIDYSKCKGARIKQGIAVSRAFGDFYYHPLLSDEPQLYSYPLAADKEYYAFFCTDGLWKLWSQMSQGHYPNNRFNPKKLPSDDIYHLMPEALKKQLKIENYTNTQEEEKENAIKLEKLLTFLLSHQKEPIETITRWVQPGLADDCTICGGKLSTNDFIICADGHSKKAPEGHEAAALCCNTAAKLVNELSIQRTRKKFNS